MQGVLEVAQSEQPCLFAFPDGCARDRNNPDSAILSHALGLQQEGVEVVSDFDARAYGAWRYGTKTVDTLMAGTVRGDDVMRSIAKIKHLDGSFSATQVHFGQPNSMANLMRRTMQHKTKNQFQHIDFI
jgi:hypothetical protein